MFCSKCGKQNPDGAVFCCFCGFSMKFEATTPPVASPIQPTPTGQPVQQVQPAQPVQPVQPTQPVQPAQPVQPVQPIQPVQPVQPAQQVQPVQPIIPNFSQTSENNAAAMKNSKKRFILPICIAAVVVICAVLAIILIPRLGKVPVSEPDDDSTPTTSGKVPGTTGDDVSGTPGGILPGTPGGIIPGTPGGIIPGTPGGSIPGTSGGVSIPSGNEDPGNNPSGELRMTLSGKNIPVKMSMFGSYQGQNYVMFLGKTNDQLFGVAIYFLEVYPQANSSYNEAKDGNNMAISLMYSGKEVGSRNGYYNQVNLSADAIAKWNVSIDGFEPNKSIEISTSGSVQDNGLVFKFEASGKVNFQSKSIDDVLSELEQWVENNKIPADGNTGGNNKDPGNNPSGELRMTLNGKNIPVELSMLCSEDGESAAIFAGKTNDQRFAVVVLFTEGYPQANSSYNNAKDQNNAAVGLIYSDAEVGYVALDSFNSDKATWNISVNSYERYDFMDITVSGTIEDDGLVFKFEASGKVNFRNDTYSFEEWVERNMNPAG